MSTNVSVSALMCLDERQASNALPDAIGDRYLYNTNSIFANVRDVALHFGYRFSHRVTRLWHDYQALPLLTLDRIIKGKVIPYFDNRSTLARLLERNSQLAMPASFILGNVKHNHTLHEAAHCVASTIFRQYDSHFVAVCPSKKERFVFKEILSEAFANTVETLAAAVDQSPLPAIFYALNSYMGNNAKCKEVLDRAREEFGDGSRFLILLLCYFEANLTPEPPTESTSMRVLAAADLPLEPEPDAELLAGLIAIGFHLNPSFRENTAPTYFGLLECEAEYRALGQAGWLEYGRNQDLIRRIGGILADLVLQGTRSRFVNGHSQFAA